MMTEAFLIDKISAYQIAAGVWLIVPVKEYTPEKCIQFAQIRRKTVSNSKSKL